MSLISIKNLAGPLKSKFQMGALAIAVVLVLVIRLGSSRPSEGRQAAEIREEGSSDNLLDVLKDTSKKRSAKNSAQANDELLEGLVAEGLDEGAPAKSDDSRDNESFDDIRKSLGLE